MLPPKSNRPYLFIYILTLTTAFTLVSPSADAERYEVIEGRIAYWDTGETSALQGFLETAPSESAASTPENEQLWIVEDFDLVAAGQHFGPGQPVEHEGFRPGFWRANGFLLDADGDIPNFAMRSRGDLVAVSGDVATFRFVDWRGDPSASRARGMLPDGSPARLDVRGALVEYAQSYRLPPDSCPVTTGEIDLPTPPITTGEIEFPTAPPGEGTIICAGCEGGGATLSISGEAGVVISSPRPLPRPISPGPPIRPIRPINDVGGATLIAGGTETAPLRSDDVIQRFQSFDLASDRTVPFTRVPSGEGSGISISGGQALEISGTLQSVSLEAGSQEAVDPATSNEILIANPTPPLFCEFLVPLGGMDPPRVIGAFEFNAAVVESVEIAIEPRRSQRPINPLRRSKLRVAILGSEDFDVRDVRVHSLRLGPDEAPPAGRRRTRFRDVNRDGYRDLVVRFRTRETGVSSGDTSMCLRGASALGTTIHGCAPVDTQPLRPRRYHRHDRQDRDDRRDRDDRDDRRDRDDD